MITLLSRAVLALHKITGAARGRCKPYVGQRSKVAGEVDEMGMKKVVSGAVKRGVGPSDPA